VKVPIDGYGGVEIPKVHIVPNISHPLFETVEGSGVVLFLYHTNITTIIITTMMMPCMVAL
jgi:hypothetical protein|tara:strand:+ start:6561 stop:6743 length:183 start_codon:yes stop_codon:yes gene_type:complete